MPIRVGRAVSMGIRRCDEWTYHPHAPRRASGMLGIIPLGAGRSRCVVYTPPGLSPAKILR